MNRIVIGVLIGLLFFSCKKDPGFDEMPTISFSSIRRYEFVNQNTLAKEEFVDVVLNFEDGDGDLGVLGSGTTDNLQYQRYRRTKGKDTLIADWVDFRFNDLAPESSYVGPLSGDFTLSIELEANDTTFVNNDTVFYKLYIEDRAGNKSNVVTTPTVIVFPK